MQNLIYKLARPILALPRAAKRLVALLIDISLCVMAVWLAFYLRLDELIGLNGPSEWDGGLLLSAITSVILAIPIFVVSGFYRAIFRYNGWPALLSVGRALAFYGFLYSCVFTLVGVSGVPRTVGIIQPLLLLVSVGASRALARVWLGGHYQSVLQHASRPKVLIYGAGRSGRQLAQAIVNGNEIRMVGFLDDDESMHGHVLNGQPVYNPADLSNLVSALKIDTVLLAMPNLDRKRSNEILIQIQRLHVAVRTLPSLNDIAQGKVDISNLGELGIDDLLGREPVIPNNTLLALKVSGKVVVVTGAGGSIGSELCRQIIFIGPKKLLLIEQSEYALYRVHQELEAKLDNRDIAIVPLLASVQDSGRMREIISTWKPDTVYHAAAYKHVPLVEHNPAEGIKNNVLGTLHTAQASAENRVSDFVLISTDKAVRPTNFMGASKRLAEIVLQALAATSPGTKFSMVRFGNVLGSSGSVVPKFRQQIRDGGPISLTHPDITRYFMTIPEAAQLVIQAGAMAKGGDVFVLDMGKPVKIIDLAKRMIELSGLTVKDEGNPHGNIEIQITGLRHGEKLFEELLIGDNPEPTSHSMIMKAQEQFIPWADLKSKLDELVAALNTNDVDGLRQMMQKLVSGYTPDEEVVDWVYLEQAADLKCSMVASEME